MFRKKASAPKAPAARWLLLETSPIVVAIPRDAASQAYTRELIGNPQVLLPAEIYVGPYLVQGMVLRDEEDTDTSSLVDTLSEYVLVQDAVVDCLAPGARLKRLSVPLAVVRTDAFLQGFVPLQ